MKFFDQYRGCWTKFLLVLAVGALYFAGAQLGHFLSLRESSPATISPANAVLVAALLRLPCRRWFAILAAASCASVVSDVGVQQLNLAVGIAFAVANLIEASLAAYLLNRISGGHFALRRPSDIGYLIAIAIILCPLIGAAFGSAAGALLAEQGFFQLWHSWFTSHAVGMAMLAPPLILFSTSAALRRIRLLPTVEALVLGLLLIAVCGGIFGVWPIAARTPFRFPMYVIPFFAWAGTRFGPRGASLAAVCVALFASWATSRDIGWYAFLELPIATRVAAVQAFTLIISLTPLSLATVLEAQRASDRRFGTLVAHSPTVVFETDTSGRCTYVNQRWTQLTGKPLELALGFEWISTVYIDDRERVVKSWLAMTARGDEEPTLECRYYGIEDKVHWVIMNAVAMRNQSREVIGYLGTILDITDRREAEIRLQEAYEDLERRVEERTSELTSTNLKLQREIAERNRAAEQLQQQQSQLTHFSRLSTMGQMAAGLAHEVNQPLYAISNYARGMLLRLETGVRPDSEMREALDHIACEAERAGEILRRVRTFSRRQPADSAYISLDELVQDALRLTAFEARQRSVLVEGVLRTKAIKTVCDPIQIQQVLVNLIRNGFEAIDALSPITRLVTIETLVKDNDVECAITDSGAGVPPGDHDRIFDPFFTTKPQGLGMGLPISRSLIESLGGKLWVERRALGGATFRFTIPRAEAPPQDIGLHERDRAHSVSG
jgi:two-component system sensor kinase FixL